MRYRFSSSLFFTFLILILLNPVVSTFAQFAPNQITGLKLWLRADSAVTYDSSYKVSLWNDCSGDSNTVFQSTLNFQPTLVLGINELNNRSIIRFDGIDDYMITVFGITLSQPNTIFVVYNMGNTGNYQFVFDGLDINNRNTLFYYNDGTIDIAAGAAGGFPSYTKSPPFNYIINSCFFNGANSQIYENGILKSIGNTGNHGLTGLKLGAHATVMSMPFKGDIAEIIVYNSALNNTERNLVENYLINKYTPLVNLGPDIIISYGFCDTILNAGSQFIHYHWSTGDTTQTINVSHSGTYSVTATNIFGENSTDTVLVNFPQILLNDTIFCSGNSFILSPGLTGNYTYYWSDSTTNATDTIISPGNYSVTITDSASCSTVSNVVTVNEDNFPVVAGLGPDIDICTGNTIGLVTPIPLPDNLTYNWSTLENTAQIIIVSPGIYAVTVADSIGCIAIDTISVNITGTAPAADFSFILGCSGTVSSFMNTSVPPGDSWLWNFDDGQTDTTQNPIHIYANKGNYAVSLTVSDSICSNTILKSIYINGVPTAAFSADTACANHTYNFTDQSSSNGGAIVSWDWDFGDATMHSTLQNPPHNYTAAGSYNVTLTIITDSSCQSSIQQSIVVVNTATTPTYFSLYRPSNNYITSNNLIEFGWNPSLGSASYTLEYSTDSLFLSNVVSISDIIATTHQLSLPTFQNYFWRVTAINICGNQTTSETRKIIMFSPGFISGLQLWLKADSGTILNENKLSQWNDCSGNTNNMDQPNSSFQPILINSIYMLNNKPAIRFDGFDDYMQKVFSTTLSQPNTIFVIYNMDSTGFYQFVYDGIDINNRNTLFYFNDSTIDIVAGASGGFPYYSKSPPFNYIINSCFFNEANSQIYENGILKSIGNAGNQGLTGLKLGAHATVMSMPFKGDIAEIIMYNSALSNTDRKTVENYLNDKYAPPVNLGPDINIAYGLCDTILDAGGRFTHFIWSTGDTTQTINITQSGQYSVTATNIFGQLSHDEVLVNMPSFMVHDTAFCLGDSLVLSANLGSSYSYLWLPDSVTTETFSITQPGNYSLSVYDTIGCQRTIAFTVTADSFAVQASLGPDKNICQGDIITLAVGAQEATSYLWSNSTGNNYLSITDAPGTSPDYSVTVTDHNGCTATDTISLHIIGAMPVVSFISDSVCFGNETHFTDLSTVVPPSTIASRFWEFGDNDTSLVQDPVHVYPHAGPYQVELTVTTDSGCVKKSSKNVIVYSMPAVSFLPYNGCNGKEVPFTDLTFCPFGNLSEWHWDFGDTYGAGYDTSSLPNPVYIYDSAGTYTVKLITSSVAGCTDSTEHTITINQSPQVAFSNSSSCAGQIVYFTDETSIPPWETITEHQWLFGDGTGTSATNPSHVYDAPGTYEVSLNVSILNGCSATYTKQLVVGAIPDARFGYSDNCANTTTQFTDSSTSALGAIDQWSWKFGSIGASATQNPGVAFPDTGIYKVTLTVNTEHNCVDSITLPVRVYPLPHAAFSFSPEYGIPPLPVSFTNHSTGAATYLWAFGDGDNDVSLNPDHTYLLQGIFDVLLTAYNTIGCPDTISHRVYVLPTTVDILVSNTTATLNGNILNVSTDLMNNGSRKIEHIDIALQLEGGNVIHEHWYGALMQGEIIPYAFNAQPEIPGGQAVNYICVTASLLPELQEDDVSNNLSCKVLSSGFNLSEPYPNPVVSKLVIAYVLPFDGAVKVELFNEIGEKVMDVFDGEGQEGYHAHTVDLSALGAGVYSYRVLFHENSLRKKFVKM